MVVCTVLVHIETLVHISHTLDWFLGTMKGIAVYSVWCVQRCVIPGGIISSGEVCEGDGY